MPPLDSEQFAAYPARVALADTPWFPEDPYQCGPQSLASLLSYAGVQTEPADLVGDVYVPGRKGSFAPELRAAARKRGRLPYQIAPSLDALATALADGYPVLILQNLGLGFAPTWHFAVVIGFDRDRNRYLLRSGAHEWLEMDPVRFERRWRLADYWGIVLLGPTDLPDWVALEQYESQLAYLEQAWAPQLAAVYGHMIERWPDSTSANLGLGNLAFAGGNLAGAERHYRQVLATDSDHIGALNNLAEVYARKGQPEAAFKLACRALRLAAGHPLEASVSATVEALQEQDSQYHCPDPAFAEE